MSREERTPRSLGYSMPAEWDPHYGTWLEMVDALHDHENVHLVMADYHQRDHVARQLQYHAISLHNVDFFIIPANDIWGEVANTDWTFNGWGERFDFDLANLVPSRIAEQVDLPVFEAPLVLEAGAVGVNGSGTFLATRSSIIDLHPNPGMSQYLGKYRKMHIPQDPGYNEKYYFAPGDPGYQVFKTWYADVRVLICWDQWFPEDARLTAMKGAEIIFIPTAIGFDPENEDRPEESHAAWKIVQQEDAVANACYLVAVNRVGVEQAPDAFGSIQFWGGSFAADLSGQVSQKAYIESAENLLCTLDIGRIEGIRNFSSYPFRDRRVHGYNELTRLYSN